MRWIFQSCTVEQKTLKKVIYSESLACFEPGLLQQMIHHFGLGVREAIHGMAPSPFSQGKKLKKSLSPGEVMITVFWHCAGVILVIAMLKWETVNSSAYIRTLSELRNHFKQIQPHQNPTEILLHHDIARPHTCL